jgi:phosphoglycolate phosphatase
MAIQNIIFDLDGTLIDSARLTGQIIDTILADRGIAAAADRTMIRKMDAIGGEAMIAAVMGKHTIDPAADLAEFRARHRTASTPADLAFPGVAETLTRLDDAGVRLAICSNKPQDLCEKILIDLGIDQHFAAIVGSTPGRPKKPAPDAAMLALALLEASPCNTLYCGDSTVDLATAEAVGVPMILVDWGYGSADVLERTPDLATISTMQELYRIAHGGHL